MRNGYDNSCIHYRQDISKYFIKIFLDPRSRHRVQGIKEVESHKRDGLCCMATSPNTIGDLVSNRDTRQRKAA
jgi:hypothetical protein